MSYWPDVNPGQAFQPSAQLENDVRHLVNQGGLAGVRTNGGGVQVENICINAVNQGSEAIPSGACIVFPSGSMVEGCVPVEKISDLTETTWGIAMDEIPSNQFGSVLVMGAAVVNVSGGSGNYIVPTSSDGVFTRSDSGSAKVLREITDGAIVLVGVTPPGSGSAPAPTPTTPSHFDVRFLSKTSDGDVVVSVYGGNIIGENLRETYISGGILTIPRNSAGGYIFAAGSHCEDKINVGWNDQYTVEFFIGSSIPSKYHPYGGSGSDLNAEMFCVPLASMYVPLQSARPVSIQQLHSGDIHFTGWNKIFNFGSGIGFGDNDGRMFDLKRGNFYVRGGVRVVDDPNYYMDTFSTGLVPSFTAMKHYVEKRLSDLAWAAGISGWVDPNYASAPNIPTISADITTPTSGNVTLTVNFANDVTVKSYRMAYGVLRGGNELRLITPDDWFNYTGPIVFSSCGILEVMAQKASGGYPSFNYYIVNNIDRNPPQKPKITADVFSATSKVKVSASFYGANVKEYKINDGDWVSYVGPVELTSNAKVTFRASDDAGNSSTEYYVVENIESSNS